jgi:hypothetical protein
MIGVGVCVCGLLLLAVTAYLKAVWNRPAVDVCLAFLSVLLMLWGAILSRPVVRKDRRGGRNENTVVY